MRYLVFLFPAMVCLLIGTRAETAPVTEIWNSSGLTTITDSDFPALHGMTMVWQARGGLTGSTSGPGDWEIFLCNLDTQQVIQLTDDDSDDTLPRTDGEYVVWQKFDPAGGNRVFLHQLAGTSPTGGELISPADGAEHLAPGIADGRVVWTTQLVTDSYKPAGIMLYDAGGDKTARRISDPAVDCTDPRIDRDKVVWLQINSDGTAAHWYLDLNDESAQAEPIAGQLILTRTPEEDNHLTVLTRRDGNDREVFLYSRTRGYVAVTDNSVDDRSPLISRNHIAWISGDTLHAARITPFMQVWGLRTSPEHRDAFRAGWEPLSGGVDRYVLDLATSPDFSTFVPGYQNVDPGSETFFDFTGLELGATYYLRISAVLDGEATDYSPTLPVQVVIPSTEISGMLQAVYRLLLL